GMLIDELLSLRSSHAAMRGRRRRRARVAVEKAIGDAIAAQVVVLAPEVDTRAAVPSVARPKDGTAENMPIVVVGLRRLRRDLEALQRTAGNAIGIQARRALHVRALRIEQVHHALLAAADQALRARDQHWAGAAEIEVVALQPLLTLRIPIGRAKP